MGRASGGTDNTGAVRRERSPALRAIEYVLSDDHAFETWRNPGPFASAPIPLPDTVAAALSQLDARFTGRAKFLRDLHSALKEIPLPTRAPVWGEMVGAGVWSALQVADLITDETVQATIIPVVEAMLTDWDGAQHILRDNRRLNFQMTLLMMSAAAGVGKQRAEASALMALSGALAIEPRALMWATATHAAHALVSTGDLDRAERFVLDLAEFFSDADSRVVA